MRPTSIFSFMRLLPAVFLLTTFPFLAKAETINFQPATTGASGELSENPSGMIKSCNIDVDAKTFIDPSRLPKQMSPTCQLLTGVDFTVEVAEEQTVSDRFYVLDSFPIDSTAKNFISFRTLNRPGAVLILTSVFKDLSIRINDREIMAPRMVMSNLIPLHEVLSFPKHDPRYYLIPTTSAALVFDIREKKFCNKFLEDRTSPTEWRFFEIENSQLMAMATSGINLRPFFYKVAVDRMCQTP